ncbi:K02A2.6-like [Cordylochernes scorpioides]|uniref:K02A2.6-like n=1 Tax=Cordylochernes scorpioides TaxID=51811 RepID=A0ABY6LT03_9ARAC|nr:K02A2.6-like [Cordylochernes scorpioides]
MNNLPPPSSFTIDQNDPYKWPKWRKKFENYIIASNLDSKSIQQQRAILLHIIGDSALEIYNTFGLLDEYKDVLKGNGHLSYIYDIKISDMAEPKISPARRLPRALLQPVKEELLKMEEDGIIEKNRRIYFMGAPNGSGKETIGQISNMHLPK